MRTLWLITFLLVVNLAALLVLIRRTGEPHPLPEATPRTTAILTSSGSQPLPPPVEFAVPPETNTFQWAQLESEDYRTYIARLREIGCPEQTIRDIIIADLDKLMAADLREIEGAGEPPKYWQPQNKELINMEAALLKLERKQEIDFQKRRAIAELLGVDLAAERLRQRGERDIYAERLSFLPPEEQAQVRMIMEQANREELRIRESSWLQGDELTEADQTRLREIEAEKQRQIAALLSPAEMEQFELWFSPSAYKVRKAFFTMEPTEEEFLAVYRLQKDFDDQWQSIDPGNPPLGLKPYYDAAKRELQHEIASELGEERYEAFQLAQDPAYRALHETAAQFKLPTTVVDQVQGYREILEEHRRRALADPALSSAQRAEVLQALTTEAEAGLVQALGPRAYRHYIRSGAADWISK